MDERAAFVCPMLLERVVVGLGVRVVMLGVLLPSLFLPVSVGERPSRCVYMTCDRILLMAPSVLNSSG
jgi:hypothetical protein